MYHMKLFSQTEIIRHLIISLVHVVIFYRHRVVVRYVGEPTCLVPAPHGNSIINRPYIRTNPSLLNNIKAAVGATGDQTGPSKIYKEAIRSGPISADVRTQPRDMKQVRYYELKPYIQIHLNCKRTVYKYSLPYVHVNKWKTVF